MADKKSRATVLLLFSLREEVVIHKFVKRAFFIEMTIYIYMTVYDCASSP